MTGLETLTGIPLLGFAQSCLMENIFINVAPPRGMKNAPGNILKAARARRGDEAPCLPLL